MEYKNRVKELRFVKASELVHNPKNWRKHPPKQRKVLNGILNEVGYADALLARETEDGKLLLIDGHLRAETTPEQEVPVLVLDVNEQEADKLLAVIDPISAMAQTDEEALEVLLDGLEVEDEDLGRFLNLPDKIEEDITEKHIPVEMFQLVIECENAEDQKEWYERLVNEGKKVKVLNI